MNKNLQSVEEFISQSGDLSDEKKEEILKALKDANKELEITAFKLERTEKVKKTTAILLEETIEELEQKRKAVEQQNRELEIETALEKVRSSALAMNQPTDMVDVCKIISDQLTLLGVKDIRNVQTAIINEKKETYLNYQYFTAYQKSVVEETEYNKHPKVFEMVLEMKRSADAFFSGSMVDEELNIFREYRKQDGQFPDPLLDEATEVHYNFYSIGLGGLGLTTYKPLPESALKIFKRFHNVFTLAYRRFIDIENAEAQAREAQIEAALERVRSRSLGMLKTDELQEVVHVVATELKNLGVILDTGGTVTCTYFQDSKDVIHWTATEDPVHPSVPYYLPYFKDELFDAAWGSKNNGDNYFAKEFSFEVKNAFYHKAFKNSDYKNLPEEYKKVLLESKSHGIAWAWSRNSAIMVPSIQGNLPTAEEKDILIRFAKVFEQAYIRFLDLQKAEAQAREAKIETALEKVRSRTMAMQRGEELKEVVVLLYKELIALGVTNFVTCGYVEINEEINRQFTWVTSPGGDSLGLFYLPLTGDATFDERYAAWKQQQIIFHQKVAGKVRSKHLAYAITTFNSKEAEEMVLSQFPDPTVFYCFNFSHGYLHLVTGSELKNEEEILLARFTRVFEQTYARFLDLQKAEVQAREAQIEAALEKVRSRSIGMQKSDELREVIQVIHDQLILLNFQIDAAGFTMDYFQNNDWNIWIANKNQSLPSQIYVPFIDHPQFNYYKSAKEKGLDFFSNTLSFEDKNSIFCYMFKFMGDYPQAEKDELLSKPGLAISQAFLKNITLWIYNLDGIPYSKEDNNTLMRFARVFEQTYVRFNDLKQAEAQAREAQIEAALERTRTQSMLMQHSNELKNISNIFHEQLLLLGIPSEFSYVWLPDEAKGEHQFWATWAVENVTTAFKSKAVTYPLDKSEPYTAACFAAWKSDKPVHIIQVPSSEVHQFFATWEELLRGADHLKPKFFPEGLFYAEAYMKYGCFGINIRRELNVDEGEILRRFTIEFERAYTRFLDLQKAEAQNKIIQAENERKTKELEDARQLQFAMLPRELPKVHNLDIAVYMKTATEVGGDYYDFHIQPDGTLNILIGDATGHGMMSGMMVSIMKSFFIASRNSIELKEFFESSNESIKDMQLGRLMMALMGVQITSTKVIATNAGMPSLLYFRNKSQKAGEFVINNMPLGGMKGSKYSLKKINYEKGDTLLLMSDGFAELMNEKYEQYGYDRVKEEFRSVAKKTADEIVEHLKDSATEWANGLEPDDDVTFVVIKVK